MLAPPSLADKLFFSEEDEGTSGTANTDLKLRQAAEPATPTETTATIPSPSKSKSSFLQGVGLDLLILPPLRRNEEDHPLHTHVIVTL